MGILEEAMGLNVDDALISRLRKAFANNLPMKKDISVTEVARLQGQRDVINYLVAISNAEAPP